MRLTVIGLGLIGGSIALAARERLDAEVCGWDLEADAIDLAISRGAIAYGAGSLAGAVAAADAVFVAAPVSALPELVREALVAAPAGCVVSDVGSTKQTIAASISDPRFVGGHPLAGAETRGVANARADLFCGSAWYLTPGEETAEETITRVEDLVAALGASPLRLTAAEHDRLVAAISHLPHVFANVLVTTALTAGASGVTGPSFRDGTRVAGSNPGVWSAIFMDNRDEVGRAIGGAVALLEEFRDQLRRGDAEAIRAWCERAVAERERLRG